MISHLVSDFSRVLLFPRDLTYNGGLNDLNRKLTAENKDYDFWSHFQLNTELLEFIQNLDNTSCSVFTSEEIQNHPAVAPVINKNFIKVFSAADLGTKKNEAGAYLEITSRLSVSPSSCFYVDDKQANIDAAVRAGMTTHLYQTNEELFKKLTSLIKR